MGTQLTKENISSLVDSGLNAIKIAQKLSFSVHYVRSLMGKYKIKSKFKQHGNKNKKPTPINKELFINLIDKGFSYQSISNELNIKKSLVQKRIREWGLKSKHIVTHTEQTKRKMSKIRIDFLKANPDKHGWRSSSKFKSVPCEKLKEFLDKKKLIYKCEFQPLLEEGRFYSIDIAFPEVKIGFEVNGNQHYNRDGTLKEYYQLRHNLIKSKGWTLCELHYSICFNLEKLEAIVSKVLNLEK